MLSKNEIKDIQSLSHKKFRDESGLFIAEGPKIVEELIQLVPSQVEHVYATPEWEYEAPKDISVINVTGKELERISQLQTPNKVLAVVKKFAASKVSPGITVYLDSIQDPGNMGTIIRTADWFGVQHIVCTGNCADIYNPKVVQSTMGSVARVNVFYDDGLEWLLSQNQNIYAAVLDGSPISQINKEKSCVIIIGNESRGISDAVLKYATKNITIPRKGSAESLNAAVATGIILSHLVN